MIRLTKPSSCVGYILLGNSEAWISALNLLANVTCKAGWAGWIPKRLTSMADLETRVLPGASASESFFGVVF